MAEKYMEILCNNNASFKIDDPLLAKGAGSTRVACNKVTA
jgi:hypothetical protein